MNDPPDGDRTPIVTSRRRSTAALAITDRRHDRARRAAGPRDALRRPPGPQRRARRLMAGGRARPTTSGPPSTPPAGRSRSRRSWTWPCTARTASTPIPTAAARRPARRLPDVAGGRPLFGAVRRPLPRRRVGRASAGPTRSPSSTPAPGPGTLARAVLAAAPGVRGGAALRRRRGRRAAQRARHPAGVESRADLPAGPIDGVVLANELLDNLPFRLAVHDGAWREAYVVDGAGRLVRRGPVGAVRPAAGGAAGDRRPTARGPRCRTPPRRGSARPARIVRRGHGRRRRLRPRRRPPSSPRSPWRAWLRTYRGHERGRHPLADPGDQDITVDVALDQLPEPDAVRTQAQFLRRWGIDELVDEGRAAWRRPRPRARPRGDGDAQPGRRGGGAARPGRARRVRRRSQWIAPIA